LRSLYDPRCRTKVLLVTPERLHASVALQNALHRMHADGALSRFVIDEAHCVIAWGRDFRPDYLRLGEMRNRYAGVPWLLLTATLPPRTRGQLFTALHLDEEQVVRVEADLNRPHLHYEVRCLPPPLPLLHGPGPCGTTLPLLLVGPLTLAAPPVRHAQVWPKSRSEEDVERVAALMQTLQDEPGGAIVYCHSQAAIAPGRPVTSPDPPLTSGVFYCRSQAETERVCDLLCDQGVPAAFYHAQVEPEAKAVLHQQWLDDTTRVIVATSAFGMGVHKADVRLVVHWTMPDSIMALSQEWGRAGRDGQPARCVLLYSYHDKGRVEGLIRRSPNELPQRLDRLLEVRCLPPS
jgi:superfamily II DNA helicase RecQ